MKHCIVQGALVACLLVATAVAVPSSPSRNTSTARYLDKSEGRDWPGYGRTFGQQHYTPLAQINQSTIGRLGLAWSMDLGPQNSATQPIAVNGVLYFATGLSVVQAVDAASGKLLWRYDPQAAEKAGLNLRLGWGTRGIAWWNDKIYTGTQDGRLIAIDTKSGQPVWSVQTFSPDYPAHINGAPRVFAGKVIVGYAGTTGATRGYVTTYDAETGKQLWRFYTVPGNPAEGFENKAMEMAAKTWAGEWWKFGGGADVWNSIAYDTETDTVFIGTGSGYPWNRRVRSADQGDNLFVASIVALNGTTGAYKWHYQVSPGDTWDHDATMDIELADLTIGGKVRKVLMQAPKNGFFYVIDRITGQLISAEPYAKVTWASRIDLTSGRPVEALGVRYPNGMTANIWPSCAHSWMPMAYSPKTHLTYIPVIQGGGSFSDQGMDFKNWRPPTDRTVDGALGGEASDSVAIDEERANAAIDVGELVAWNPTTQRMVWRVPHPTYLNGGILATGGDLIFQGTIDGTLKAYSATTGRVLWSFAAQAPLIATPISYSVKGRQYVTLLTGLGMNISATAGALGRQAERYGIDPRTQARRVLTFALDGKSTLPPASPAAPPPDDPDFKPDTLSAHAGKTIYDQHCIYCHGISLIGSIHAPDLRRSAVPLATEAFFSVVRGGALVPNGMPAFGELTDTQLANLRQYIRTEAKRLRDTPPNTLPAFKKIKLTGEFWSEGAAFGDFNRDGHNDIVSGPYWYEGPDFSHRHEFRPAQEAKFLKITADMKGDGHPDEVVYSDSFFAFVYDVNGDQWPDILSIGLPGEEASWYENPGKAGLATGVPWKRHVAFDSVTNESPTLADLFGNGQPVILCMSGDVVGYVAADWSHPQQKWIFHAISSPLPALVEFHRKFGNPFPYTHGLGYGDVNADGRADVLGPEGWWEQPATLEGDPVWTFHKWSFLQQHSIAAPARTSSGALRRTEVKDEDKWPYVLGGAQIYAYDVNGDGLPDIISSLDAHGYGLAWFEQLRKRDARGEIQFKTHLVINKEPTENAYGVHFSQLHAVDLADIDGDGLKDIITGKRFWAHGRYGDEEPDAPAVLYWFKLMRKSDGQAEFVPHLVDDDSGVGTQVLSGDINGDEFPDIVVGNKKGTFVFLQTGRFE